MNPYKAPQTIPDPIAWSDAWCMVWGQIGAMAFTAAVIMWLEALRSFGWIVK